jgi:DNA invertase Pin-like site-specific DNA recombinase
MIQETIIGDLRKHGFTLVSVSEPDLLEDDPSRKLMRQVFGAIAEYEKTMIVLKLRGARSRMKARTGRCEGRKPFGDRPGEAPTLKRMNELRVEGLSFARIAERLNLEGRKPRAGQQWHPGVVRRIAQANS